MLRTRLAVFPILLFSYIKIAGQEIKTKTAFKICFNIFLIFGKSWSRVWTPCGCRWQMRRRKKNKITFDIDVSLFFLDYSSQTFLTEDKQWRLCNRWINGKKLKQPVAICISSRLTFPYSFFFVARRRMRCFSGLKQASCLPTQLMIQTTWNVFPFHM